MTSLWVLLGGELKMQLRQHMTALLVLIIPLFGIPGAMIATGSYQAQVQSVDEQSPSTSEGPALGKLPVSVPVEAEGWIRESDGLLVVPEGDPRSLARLTIEGREALVEYSPSMISSRAKRRLEGVILRRRYHLRNAALDAAGLPALRGEGLTWDVADVASQTKPNASLLLPLSLLTMLMVGSFTALDVLTGERERGTIETLLSTGADRRAVIAAKSLTVGLATLLSGILGLIGVSAGARLGLSGLPVLSAFESALLAACIVLLAVFSAALSVIFAISAPSYRSASLTMGLVVLLPVLPTGLGTTGFELTPAMALVPIGNLSLALRDTLTGTLTAADALLVALASLLWTGIVFSAAIWRTGSEEALLQPNDPAALRRAGFYGKEAAAVFAVALLFTFTIGGPAQSIDLVMGLLFSQIVLTAAVGVGGLSWVGLPLRETLSLRMPSLRDLLLAIAAGITLPGASLLAAALVATLLPIPEAVEAGFEPLLALTLPERLLVGALLPAICEEILFRGALLGMMSKSPVVWRVVTNALLFGALHLSIHRLPSTVVLGLFLAAAQVRSRSLLVPCLVHALNNTIALALLPELLDGPSALAGALCAAVIAIAAIAAMGRTKR